MFFYGSRVMPPVYILWLESYVPCLLILEKGGINVLWIDSSMVPELRPLFVLTESGVGGGGWGDSRVMAPVYLDL